MAEWHVITGEYPPQPGGVSDYTRIVASGLAAAGDTVHVWCPHSDGAAAEDPGVVVHRELGTMRPSDLVRAGHLLNQFPKPRRLLVQWVPHAFGCRSANVPVSLWIWSRALLHGDCVDLMIHEPYLPLPQRELRHTALAVAHRMMMAVILRAASRAWVAIPKWEEFCRPYAFGRPVPFEWMPVISNIPTDPQSVESKAVRDRCTPPGGFLIGHFSSCNGAMAATIRATIRSLLDSHPNRAILLIGQSSQQLGEAIVSEQPQLRERIHCTGSLSSQEVSLHISACDVMLQPYPDGVSSRRGSVMAALAHGKPVVTTFGSLSEPFWKNSSAISLVPAGDNSRIVASIDYLLADEHERNRLGIAARMMYTCRFDLARTIDLLRNQDRLPHLPGCGHPA